MTYIRKADEVLEEVDEIAESLRDDDPDLLAEPLEATRAAVWSAVPELYDEYRQALAAEPATMPEMVDIAKATREPTLADEIAEAVHNRAEELAWTRWPAQSEAVIRADLWLSEDGAALYGLAKSDLGRLSAWQASQIIRKSSEHARAWAVLEEWS